MLNVPLKDGFAGMRIALFTDHQAGYIDAVGPAAGSNINSGNTDRRSCIAACRAPCEPAVRLTALDQIINRNGNDIVDYDITTGRPTEVISFANSAFASPTASKPALPPQTSSTTWAGRV